MNIRAFLNLLVVALAATAPRLAAQALPQTTAERTNYAATSTNADVGAFLDSLGLAEAPETRASLARVYTTWDPALMVDLHTTDGTLHGYQLTYAPPLDPNGPAGPTAYVRDRMLPTLRQTLQDKYREPIFDYGNVETQQTPQSWDTYAPL